MKKIKFSLGLLFVLTVSGCEPSASDHTDFTVMPKGFEGCKVGEAYDGATFIYMVRCPNSTTTTSYTSNKTKKYVVVDDDDDDGIKSE